MLWGTCDRIWLGEWFSAHLQEKSHNTWPIPAKSSVSRSPCGQAKQGCHWMTSSTALDEMLHRDIFLMEVTPGKPLGSCMLANETSVTRAQLLPTGPILGCLQGTESLGFSISLHTHCMKLSLQHNWDSSLSEDSTREQVSTYAMNELTSTYTICEV